MNKVNEIVGKTVKSVEVIRAEIGRMYNNYTCIVFTDGTKIMLPDFNVPWRPYPSIEEMKKAPNYFSPQDIADEVLRRETNKRKQKADERKRKEKQLERLKKELEIE
jgi:hypothetical protein